MIAEAIVLIPKSANKGTEIQMDVLPLVLCKDCKHGSIYCTEDTHGETLYECNIHGIAEIEVHRFDWFCADGERKETI